MTNTEIKYLEDKYEFSIHDVPLDKHKKGLFYSPTGYGSRIPTRNMVFIEKKKRWYRVYATQYSNAGSCWITVDKERYVLR